jgi:hypothetical protein
MLVFLILHTLFVVLTCLDSLPQVVASLDGLVHPEYYHVSDTWLNAWDSQESALTRLRILSSPDDLLFLPDLDKEILVHLEHTLCRIIIITGPPRTGKTEWLQKRLPRLLPARPHVYIDISIDTFAKPRERLVTLFAEIDHKLGMQDAVHTGRAIISLDEPMRLLRGLSTDTELTEMADGLFQPFDNGLQLNQKPSHLFIADTNHFALPLLLAAQSREGNEARDHAMVMPLHRPPAGGTGSFYFMILVTFLLLVLYSCYL